MFGGKLLLTLFIQRLQTFFFKFLSRFLRFNVFYFAGTFFSSMVLAHLWHRAKVSFTNVLNNNVQGVYSRSLCVCFDACRLLTDIIDCLTTATAGCTALMDVTEQKLSSLNANNASSACNVATFTGPTTSAPLAIFQTITFPTTTTTTQPRAAVILGGTVPLSQCHSRDISSFSFITVSRQ